MSCMHHFINLVSYKNKALPFMFCNCYTGLRLYREFTDFHQMLRQLFAVGDASTSKCTLFCGSEFCNDDVPMGVG